MKTNAPTGKQLPAHVVGLLKFLSTPFEKANEDLALNYFRKLYPSEFTRQSDATGADGYVPGSFVLELKGKTGGWLAGLFQGMAYKRDLDFSTVVVAAKDFLAVWRLSDIPDGIRAEILSSPGAASAIGQKFARQYSSQKTALHKKALWRGEQMFLDLFASHFDVVLSEIRAFETTLRESAKVRRSIRPSNFTVVLKQMSQYFDPTQPIKAVSAFYSMVYAWGEDSVLQFSQKAPDQATLGGEAIKDLIPGKRVQFKEFVESHAVRPGPAENIDDFFSRYDEALDAVDKDFRIRHGIFFTDLDLSKLALWLVKQHIPDLGKNYIVIDPACGSGNLVTNWRSPLELRHKVVSEIQPDLLYVVERRMKGDQWHNGKFTVVPKISEGRGLNFLDKSANEYLGELTRYLKEKGHQPNKPLAFLCNPPYRSDDDQTSGPVEYQVDSSIAEVIGKDASAERYCCFLAQMSLICKAAVDSGLPGDSAMLVFTKAAWLTDRTMFRGIRKSILSQYEDCAGFIVNSKQFFDVKGKFPVAFTVWKYVGENAQLNPDRPVILTDLTWVTKADVSGLPWEKADLIDAQCRALFDRSIRIALGSPRQPMKAWVGQTMTDFKRDRRKAERTSTTAGGLPKDDRRLGNKKVYGDQAGRFIGFMDDLTPCRTGKATAAVPHFHLDPRFMRVRDYRCLSGHCDHYSYAADTATGGTRLFLWYSIGRTFAQRGYPLWVDASEIWAPEIPSKHESVAVSYALAIALAENECVETVFPGNNPVAQAAEIWCSNPMAPNTTSSFWSQHLAHKVTAGASAAKAVDGSVKELYKMWMNRVGAGVEIHASYRRPYFISEGVLRQTAGIVQIKDFATETNDTELLGSLQQIRRRLAQAKDEFYELLVDKNGINYFGQGSARRIEYPPTQTDGTLKKAPKAMPPRTKRLKLEGAATAGGPGSRKGLAKAGPVRGRAGRRRRRAS